MATTSPALLHLLRRQLCESFFPQGISGALLLRAFTTSSSAAMASTTPAPPVHAWPTEVAEERAGASTQTSQAGSVEQKEETPKFEQRDKLLVIGGNGFVGSHILKEAVSKGIKVASLNRSGRPPISEAWVNQVEWIAGSVFDPARWRTHLKDVQGVISCVGGFGSYETMKKLCGDANIVAAETAAEEGVKRFVFVSAADLGLPSFLLRGYFEGKREAEEAVRRHFPYGGVILRPAMIHGTRRVAGVGVPLQLVGAPTEFVLRSPVGKFANALPLVGPLFAPPIKATSVAKVAVRAATDNAVPPGILDVWQMERLAQKA